MDIFSNIWNAINTPNQLLINICYVFINLFIEIPLTFHLISTVFNITCSKFKKYIYILVVTTISSFAMFLLKSPYNVILNYTSSFIVLYLIFRMNIIKTLVAALFPSIVFSLVGSLIFTPYLNILNITTEQATTIPIFRIPFSISMYLIVYIFTFILKYRKIVINILEDFDKTNKSIVTLNFIFGFFNIVMQVILTSNYADILPIEFTFFNSVSLLIYFGLSFFSLAKIMSLAVTKQKLESAEEYNKTLHILHDNVRGFKHDFDNIVTTIGGYIKTNDMKGLEKYYSQLQEDCEKVNNLYILNPDIVNNPGIYNLLTTKYSKAEEKGIKVNLTFLLDLNDINMKIYEFTKILGILLDNSIEAAAECDNKILNIVFRNDSKNNRNIVLIENTYKNKDVDLDQIFDKGVSGKENHTGLGLWEIRQILKKNNNVNLNTTKDDEYFSQQLEIYY